MYEMLFGKTPFHDKSDQAILKNIEKKKPKFYKEGERRYNPHSEELRDCMNKLLQKNYEERLGSISDDKEILSHPFFKDIDL